MPAHFELKCGVGSDSHTRSEWSGCIVSEQISARLTPVAAPSCDLPRRTRTDSYSGSAHSHRRRPPSLAGHSCARLHSDSKATPIGESAPRRPAAAHHRSESARNWRICGPSLSDTHCASPTPFNPPPHESAGLLCIAPIAPVLLPPAPPAPIAHRQHGGVARGGTVAARNRDRRAKWTELEQRTGRTAARSAGRDRCDAHPPQCVSLCALLSPPPRLRLRCLLSLRASASCVSPACRVRPSAPRHFRRVVAFAPTPPSFCVFFSRPCGCPANSYSSRPSPTR